jgi:hypothetical protein
LGAVKMKIRSLVQWLYSALCAHSLESTFLKIGGSTKTGAPIGIASWNLPTFVSAKTFLCEAL